MLEHPKSRGSWFLDIPDSTKECVGKGTGVCALSSGHSEVGLHEELVKVLNLFLPTGLV
jgi:hypothetical protein